MNRVRRILDRVRAGNTGKQNRCKPCGSIALKFEALDPRRMLSAAPIAHLPPAEAPGDWPAAVASEWDSGGGSQQPAFPAATKSLIDVGDWPLLPNTSGQQIPIYVVPGDDAPGTAGVNFNIQVGDGGPPVGGTPGPEIQYVQLVEDLSHPLYTDQFGPTIFGAVGNQGHFGTGSLVPQIYAQNTATLQGSVPPDGLLAVLTIDTTGFFLGDGPWAFTLSETLNGETTLNDNTQQVEPIPLDIIDGEISIIDPGGDPIASFTAAPNPVACGQAVSFDASGSTHTSPARDIVIFEWDIDYDGTFEAAAVGPTLSHAFAQFGTRTVALRVTDDNVPAKTDVTTIEIDVSLGNRPPVADPNGPYVLHVGDALRLDGSGSSDPDAVCGDEIVSYEWDLNNDGQFDDAVGAQPTVTWAELEGLPQPEVAIPVALRVTDTFGVSRTDTTTLTIFENRPIAAFTASPNPVGCGQAVSFDASASRHTSPAHDIVIFEWDIDYDGTFEADAAGPTLSHAFSQFGTRTVALRVTDDNVPARTDVTTVEIDVSLGNRAPVADAGSPYVLAIGEDLQLDGMGSSDPDADCGDSIVSYSWDVDNDGQFDDAVGAQPLIPWAALSNLPRQGVALPIALQVTDTFGAIGTHATTLSIFENRPIATFTAAPNPVACGQTVSFDASSSTHTHPSQDIVIFEWDWEFDGTFEPDAVDATASHAYSQFGMYTAALRVTDNNVPSQSDVTTIEIDVSLGNRPPVADPNGPYVLAIGEDLQLDGTGSSDPDADCGDSIVSYEWDLNNDGQFDDAIGERPLVPWAALSGLARSQPLTIRLAVTDTFGARGTDTTTLTIPVPPPTANNDGGATDEDTPVTIDVLANDTQTGGTPLAVVAVSPTSGGGTVTNNGTDVTYDPNGAFEHLVLGQTATDTFTYTASNGQGGSDTATVTVVIDGVGDAEVVGRHVFYNRSAFDGNDPAANADDDRAVAPDKAALQHPGAATFANYTSYSLGINGIMVDVAGLPEVAGLTAGDFEFRVGGVGDDVDPASWVPGPEPSTIAVRPGAGEAGSDRITLLWPDRAIQKQWLQVTVGATVGTGLAAPDVFYFGNAVGEGGNSDADARVTSVDLLLARNNPRHFLDPAAIDYAYDYNRDTRVDVTDLLLARNNQTDPLTALSLLDLSGPEEENASVAGAAVDRLLTDYQP